MMIELKTSYGTACVNPDFVSSIDFQTDNCFVRCDGTDYRVTHDVGHELLAKINGEKSAQPDNVVRAIVSIECCETYSRSTQRNFFFWRCTLESGEKVNIFDHPDKSRNTFQIAQGQGWAEFLIGMDMDIDYEMIPPVPVTVSHAGEWYSLVGIMARANYTVIAKASEFQDMTPDDMPWDTPTIDFDDDDEIDTSMEAILDDESDGDDDDN